VIKLVLAGADDARLARFHAGIYMDAFAAQQEPLDVWQRALRGELPYELTVRLAVDPLRDAILGGIAYELYPRSRCGLMTYMVVAPEVRGRGLGEQLFREAAGELRARGAKAVLGEVQAPSGWRGSSAGARACSTCRTCSRPSRPDCRATRAWS